MIKIKNPNIHLLLEGPCRSELQLGKVKSKTPTFDINPFLITFHVGWYTICKNPLFIVRLFNKIFTSLRQVWWCKKSLFSTKKMVYLNRVKNVYFYYYFFLY